MKCNCTLSLENKTDERETKVIYESIEYIWYWGDKSHPEKMSDTHIDNRYTGEY